MGTSTARRGPGTAAWRWAKGAATRYMASEDISHGAQELLSRYVAALKESSRASAQGLLADFRLIRKVAQNLGELGERSRALGLPEALADMGLPPLATAPGEVAALSLVARWLPGEFGLEAAVAATALAPCLKKLWGEDTAAPPPKGSAGLVKTFLALALAHRLLLDLGESLEGAATSWSVFNERSALLEKKLQEAAQSVSLTPPRSGEWLGLPGWLWVTRVLENLFHNYTPKGQTHKI
uniref:Uncharacterized protein n=1 Tax=Desulfobacca acetoxidans TaxID=60893 RepID=A0A7C5ALF5_9BACT